MFDYLVMAYKILTLHGIVIAVCSFLFLLSGGWY